MKTLYAVNTHSWGRQYDELTPVQSARCADCGRLLFRPTALGQREFYFLGEKAVKNSIVREVRTGPLTGWPDREILRAVWARENRKAVDAAMIYDGYDENGNRQVFCHACGQKTIEATCVRCGKKFIRTRDLAGGWACETCFSQHCTAMCSVAPGERLAGTLGDQDARQLYDVALQAAKYGKTSNLEFPLKKRIRSLKIKAGLAQKRGSS